MLTITGASARDKHPGRVLPELIKTRPWGSYYRAEGRALRSQEGGRELLRDTGRDRKQSTHGAGDFSVISASVFELSAPVRIKQRLESAEGVL